MPHIGADTCVWPQEEDAQSARCYVCRRGPAHLSVITAASPPLHTWSRSDNGCQHCCVGERKCGQIR